MPRKEDFQLRLPSHCPSRRREPSEATGRVCVCGEDDLEIEDWGDEGKGRGRFAYGAGKIMPAKATTYTLSRKT